MYEEGYETPVLVTPFSFTSSASCVKQAGGVFDFVDIDPRTYCLDAINYKNDYYKPLAVIPVHLFGGCADMDAIKALNVPVIEDACQAIGSKYKGKFAGAIGDCGVFSFNQSKPISCGEGGMMITNDDDIAYKAKLVRNHGEVVDPGAGIVGYNYRMTEIEAIIAYHRFLKLDEQIYQRQKNVEYFRERLGNIPGVTPMWINPDVEYSWYVYAFEVEKGNHEVARKMTEAGIPLRAGYITQPLNMAYGQSCPVCEEIWHDRIIVSDVIGKDIVAIDQFINTLRKVLSNGR
jgi:dTDP-4-amino-4,6-dideoxygalactose transaminase